MQSSAHLFIHGIFSQQMCKHKLKSGCGDPVNKKPVKHSAVMCDICPSTGRHPAAFSAPGGACRVEEYPAELRHDDHMAGKAQSPLALGMMGRATEITTPSVGKGIISRHGTVCSS